MSLEQAKILAQELGLDEQERVMTWEEELALAKELGMDEPDEDDGEGAILARDFGLNGQTPPEDKPLDLITEEILFYKRQAGGAIIEIGKRLLEAKSQLSHGEWLPWLREKVDISERRAQDFMRIAREYSKSAEIADLGASKALALLALPESERAEFASETHLVNGAEKSVSEMTAKELKTAIEERDKARREAEEQKAAAEAAEASRAKMEQDMRQLKGLLDAARDNEREKAGALEAAERELQTLRDRPVEVAVETRDASPEQISAARAEGVRQGKAEAEKAGKRSLSEAEERVQKLRKELEQARREAREANVRLQQAREEARQASERTREPGKLDALVSSENMMKFGVLFQSTQEMVNRLADAVEREKPENQKKMRAALRALADAIFSVAQGREAEA